MFHPVTETMFFYSFCSFLTGVGVQYFVKTRTGAGFWLLRHRDVWIIFWSRFCMFYCFWMVNYHWQM